MFFKEKLMSPTSQIPPSWIPTDALAPAHIIIQELWYVDIIY